MTKLKTFWIGVSESLWFVPGLCAVASVALAQLAVWVDRNIAPDLDLPPWILGAGVEGARGVLSAIAGGLITVTGVVFSVTIVALQLASTQFTPRVLRNFTSDRPNQVVLGVFIGTFTYCLLVLRAVRSPLEETDGFLPAISVVLAVVLALVSIGFLIFFIDHLAHSIQVERILERVATQTEGVIQTVFPTPWCPPDARTPAASLDLPDAPAARVASTHSGYVQAVDEERLLELAQRHDLVIRVDRGVGEFVLEGGALVAAWPGGTVREEAEQDLREAIVVGLERTPHQDIGRGILEISDIAVKALSPGINDPTTATVCIDRLCQVLLCLGWRHVPDRVRCDDDGRARLLTRTLRFEDAIAVGLDPIREYALDHPLVIAHLLRTLGELAERLPPEHAALLKRSARQILDLERRHTDLAANLATLEAAATWSAG